MRIIATGDLHIGKSLDNFSLIEDQTYILNRITEILVQQDADVLVIAGDVYDRSVPSREAVSLFNSFLNDIVNTHGITVVMISGNHDSYERLIFAGEILRKSNLYIGEKFDNKADCITLYDQYGPVNFYLLPFMHYQEVKSFDQSTVNFDSAYKYMLNKINLNNDERNIMVTHGFLINGTEDSKEDPGDAVKVLSVGGSDYVNAEYFHMFDYTIAGHIHRPCYVKYHKIRYTGSPLKYSFAESLHKKSLLLIDLKENDQSNLCEIPLIPLRDLKVIKGSFEKIMGCDETYPFTEDYVKVVLTDKGELYEPLSKLREKYPNICELTREEIFKNKTPQSMISNELASKLSSKNDSDILHDLFEEFMMNVKGVKFEPEHEDLVKSYITEVMEKRDED